MAGHRHRLEHTMLFTFSNLLGQLVYDAIYNIRCCI